MILELGPTCTVRVAYEYSAPTPDVMYMPNGDPGYPGDPEEFYLTKVELRTADEWVDVSDLWSLMAQPSDFDPISRAAYAQLQKEMKQGPEESFPDVP